MAAFIEKYLYSFPYTNFFVSSDSKNLFFQKEEGEGTYLFHLVLKEEGEIDLETARKVFPENLRSRSFHPFKLDSKNGYLYVIADENHDEKYNLYCLNLSQRSLDKKTFVHHDTFLYEMPKIRSVNIDDIIDFELAELLLSSK